MISFLLGMALKHCDRACVSRGAGIRWICCIVLAWGLCVVLWMCFHRPTFDTMSRENVRSTPKTFAVASFLSFEGFEGCWFARDYIRSVAKLGISIRRHVKAGWSNYTMILLVAGLDKLCISMMQGIDLTNLLGIGWRIVPVDPICYDHESSDVGWFSSIVGNRYQHTCQYTKLHLWGMVEYDRILYLDADTLVVDSLFLNDVFSSTTNWSPLSLGMEPCLSANGMNLTSDACGAGALLLVPDRHEYFRLLMYRHVIAHDRFYQEQSYLLAYFSSGNGNRRTFALDGLIAPVQLFAGGASPGCSIIHYVSSFKPWYDEFCSANQRLCDQWSSACENAGQCLFI